MVAVENITVLSISTHEELKSVIQRGSEQRHTAGTQMNQESSRSHLIVSVIIESTNLQTQSVARGKVYAIIQHKMWKYFPILLQVIQIIHICLHLGITFFLCLLC